MAPPLPTSGSKRNKVSPDALRKQRKRNLTIMAIIQRSSEAMDAKKMETHIKNLAKTVDDPPVLFDWKSSSVEQFLTKAIAHGVAPPVTINNGAVFAGPVTQQMIDDFKEHLLDYLCAKQVADPPARLAATLGVACSTNKFGQLCADMGTLQFLDPWFTGVLAQPPALATALATVHHPRPASRTGEVLDLSIDGPMWG